MSIAEKFETIADAVYEKGKSDEWSDFWDSYQQNGERTDYTRSFSNTGWNNITFKPKHQIKPKTATLMFYRNTALSGEIEEIINIDFSECTNMSQCFQDLNVTRLGIINPKSGDCNLSCSYMRSLVTIDKVVFNEKMTLLNSMFADDYSLKNINTVEGVIANSNIGFSSSPLSVESMKNIITHLKNYSAEGSDHPYTVTFLKSAFDVLKAEGATSPNGNTWEEYIDDLNWNLVLA